MAPSKESEVPNDTLGGDKSCSNTKPLNDCCDDRLAASRVRPRYGLVDVFFGYAIIGIIFIGAIFECAAVQYPEKAQILVGCCSGIIGMWFSYWHRNQEP